MALLAGCGGTTTSGSAPVAGVTFSATSVSFGTVGLGASATSALVTVKNSGTGSLSVSGIAGTGDFSLGTNNCTSAVAAGTTCTLSVVFTPTALGARTGTLSLTTNAPSSPQTLALSGTGGTSNATLSALAYAYGSVNVNSSSPAQTFTLTSTGTAPLAISRVAFTGDFAQSANNCTAILAVGASCNVSVLFTPTTTGARTGAVTITSNIAGSPQVIALTGTGLAPVPFSGLPFQATVMAGTQPVAGASVQFYAAGSTANGSAGTALLQTALTSSSTGVVSVPAGYVCPSAMGPVYLVASGGTVTGTSAANANIRLMTAIGSCNGIASGAKYTINEATTVAAAYALTQFSGGGAAIGSTGTNLTGILNGFATAATLADAVTGASPGSALPAGASSPATRVNSVANMLNACAAAAAGCSALYTATTTTAAPTNTLDAVLNMARKPAANVAALYTQSLASTAYAPALDAKPTDWTMFLTFTGSGLNSPSGIGVDSTGSVWVASYFYSASKFTPQGAGVFPSGVTGNGLYNSYGLAIDLNDQVWIPNEQSYTGLGLGSVTVLTTAGQPATPGGYFEAGGFNYPVSVAIDPNGTTWVVDYGNSHVTLLNSLGTPLSGSDGYTTPLFAFPVAVAVDANHAGWIANQSSTFITKVSPDGKAFTNYNCCNGASGIAIDQGNNVWVANFYGDSVSLVSNTGTVISNGTYTGLGSVTRPQGIAIDGGGNVWVANYRQSYLTELTGVNSAAPGTSISPATGFAADSQLLEAYALAVDASGNVWVSNQGSNTITKVIGMAVPVKTPLSGLPRLP